MLKVSHNQSLNAGAARKGNEERELSLSERVSELLERFSESRDPESEFSPAVRRLLGVGRTWHPEREGVGEYRGYLEGKYLRAE